MTASFPEQGHSLRPDSCNNIYSKRSCNLRRIKSADARQTYPLKTLSARNYHHLYSRPSGKRAQILGISSGIYPKKGESRMVFPRRNSQPEKSGPRVLVESRCCARATRPQAIPRNNMWKRPKLAPIAPRFSARPTHRPIFCATSSNDPKRKLWDLPHFRKGQVFDWLFCRPFGAVENVAGIAEPWRHSFCGGAHAAHHPRAKHGRALFDGDNLRATKHSARSVHASAMCPMLTTAAGTIASGACADHRRGGALPVSRPLRPPADAASVASAL